MDKKKTEGKLEGIMRGKVGRDFRNIYKGHMDKTKGGGIRGGRWGWLRLGGMVWGGRRQLYMNNNKKSLKSLEVKKFICRKMTTFKS